MLREVTDAERRERFSFALARTLDIGPQRLQQLLYSQAGGRGIWMGGGGTTAMPIAAVAAWVLG